jgi:hypothetical protein
MLDDPQVVRVAGDPGAGFYRRHGEHLRPETGTDRVEAYSWGALTAGSGQRALWLLLLPFLLVNVAFWALPAVPARSGGGWWRVRRLVELLLRLFALSITLTLVLAVVLVSMDFVGWQCVRPGWSCSEDLSQLDFLTWQWFASPGRRLAVSAVVPVALVALLWWLARKTWRDLESTIVPAAPAEDLQTPLENRSMWNGMGPVRKLRSVHVTGALAVIGLLLAAPLVERDPGPPVWTALVGSGLLLVCSVVLTCLPSMSDRDPAGTATVPPRIDLYAVLPWSAVAVDVLTVGLLVFAAGWDAATGPLPWFATTVEWLFLAQASIVGLAVVLLIIMPGRIPAAAVVEPAPGRGGVAVDTPPAWWGLCSIVLMITALVLAGGFAAGLGLRTADLLGEPAPEAGDTDTFVMPIGYFWAAALTVPVAALALIFAGLAWLGVRHRENRILADLIPSAYPDHPLKGPDGPAFAAAVGRRRRIARAWARATISAVGQRLVGAFILLIAAIIGIGLVGYLLDPRWIYDRTRWAVNVGSFLVGGFVIGVLYVGRQAYQQSGFRRTVGILWDVGTFWPRAVHPLAPPCYTERTVPDLITRIRYLGADTDDGRVVLSCHSQGSVIGAAVVMQLTFEESSRVALLTYGSPLRRLYTRFFPAYFSVTALLRAGAFPLGRPQGSGPDIRRRWPWRNLHRPTDPIGGPIFCEYEAVEAAHRLSAADHRERDNADVDRQLIDPRFAKAPGDPSYPSICGHSDYERDDAYAASIAIIRALRT